MDSFKSKTGIISESNLAKINFEWRNCFSLTMIILTFLIINNYAQTNAEKIFNEANNSFLAGEYQKSIELYEKLISEGYNDATLFYNLGNAYYRIGKIGQAILYYEKAKALNPSDEDIIHNLNFVKLQTKDKIEKLPRFFIFEWWESILNYFNSNQLIIISYIFFVIILTTILIYIITKNIKFRRVAFYSASLSVLLFVISIVLLT
ncbi:MAG: tetratricopeptide repeat protein, partial [Ignavibacterium sp.]|nr:tetratricopeptide repeat protein [Ignavibacterium sp.]